MKKISLVGLVVLSMLGMLTLTGCGKVDRGLASLTGTAKTCIEGVMYLQFTSGATVMYNTDGTIKLCR